MNHHLRSTQVWHVFSRDLTVILPAHPHVQSAIGMSLACVCLPSYSWYSFTDPGGMEDWVGLGGWLRSETVYLPQVYLYYGLCCVRQVPAVSHGSSSVRVENVSTTDWNVMEITTAGTPLTKSTAVLITIIFFAVQVLHRIVVARSNCSRVLDVTTSFSDFRTAVQLFRCVVALLLGLILLCSIFRSIDVLMF